MGSAGLEWDSNDCPEKARLNQKTTYVSTTANINALATTYPGQLAYDTTLDILKVRNAANSAWVSYYNQANAVTETTEVNSTPVTDSAEVTPTAAKRYYAFVTLPSTDPLYIITGIEWKNGTVVAGNVTCGVDMVDADPPTLNYVPLINYGAMVAMSGTSAVQRVSILNHCPIRAGSILGVWIAFSDGATAKVRHSTGAANTNIEKATAAADNETPNAGNLTAWTTGTTRKYIKLYYRSYY